MTAIQKNLRKQIVSAFSQDPAFKTIYKKDLIQKDLLEFVTENEEKKLVEEFHNFTSYFLGFHENRKNIYSDKDQSTAIAYRLIHENLPKFIDNMNIFKKVIESDVKDNLPTLFESFSEQFGINVRSLAEIFSLDYYNMLLTQPQIELYNALIGGKTEPDGTKVQGINEYINLYNQKQTDKKNRLPKLKFLFKQILSNREQVSWLPESFVDDNQMLFAIRAYYQELIEENVLGNLQLLLESIADYDLDKIFLKNDHLDYISRQIFGDSGWIKKAIGMYYEIIHPREKQKIERYEALKEIYLKTPHFSIGFINEALSHLEMETSKKVDDYFAQMGAVNTPEEQKINLFAQMHISYMDVEYLLSQGYPEDMNLAQDKKAIAQIKTFLDSIKAIQHFISSLLLNKEGENKDDMVYLGDNANEAANRDERFYGDLLLLWSYIDQITPLYNKVRNRLTRKPFSIEKYKINFENSTLLSGWDVNKERDNTSIILRKDGNYYLAIMNKKSNKVFSVNLPSSGECYEKMDYKLLPGANKMLPKVFFSESRIAEFAPSEQLIANYEKETHKKGDNFNLQDCHQLIDFFKASINKHEEWKNFDFNFSDTTDYEDLSGFYREVENQGYKISFRNVSVDYINKLVEEGKIYLFQIYSKDFSVKSKGTKNIHTLYWNMLFDERNLSDVVYKLNGQAEIFFRKSSLKYDTPTHPAGLPIKNKNKKSKKTEVVLPYDLTKDKRYTMDKFLFHVPITMNFKCPSSKNINPLVDQYIKSNENLHFIGIDRGERHLLYISVVDSKGNIKWQESLNEINNFNYHDLLTDREKKRQAERRSWQTIEGIKNLKQGYLSQIVYKITQLIFEYDAIVVLEDLNMGFKRSRQKIERGVYQQFEKSLIDKLSFLVDKKRSPEEDGGLLSAYQLTNPFESFQKMGKRNGFIFYVPAWNTSKIDPATGFVNLFDTRYININNSKEFFSRFDSIRYNEVNDWFEFKFDYNNFSIKSKVSRTKWTLCTVGDRILNFRNKENFSQWDHQTIDLTSEFKHFFEKYGIDVNSNLKDAIVSQAHDEKEFYEKLYQLLRLTLQMRNSISNTEIDYLVSPVADKDGNFYDSRKVTGSFPKNADANGAYNIALKGLWIARKIRESKEGERQNLTMTNEEWLSFAQNKPYLSD